MFLTKETTNTAYSLVFYANNISVEVINLCVSYRSGSNITIPETPSACNLYFNRFQNENVKHFNV